MLILIKGLQSKEKLLDKSKTLHNDKRVSYHIVKVISNVYPPNNKAPEIHFENLIGLKEEIKRNPKS